MNIDHLLYMYADAEHGGPLWAYDLTDLGIPLDTKQGCTSLEGARNALWSELSTCFSCCSF